MGLFTLPYKRTICGALAFFLFFTQSFVGVAYAFPVSFGVDKAKAVPPRERVSLVAILVPEAAYNDDARIDGLTVAGSPLRGTLAERLERYGNDIQRDLPLTKTMILTVREGEEPSRIAQTLEQLYREGNGDPDAITRLAGIVLVGEVPLPVVAKGENRFLSLFPYTDFDDKAYLWNAATGQFERNPDAANPQAEIWHGVIRPPVSGQQGKELLAAYFDKNHLYRSNDASEPADLRDFYQTFQKRILMADTVEERKSLDAFSFSNYQRYLDHWEDITYNRYTKFLARDILREVQNNMDEGDGRDNDGDCPTEEGQPGYDSNGNGVACDKDDNGIPDQGVDEDPVNGLDDDGDGLIDEDPGDAFFRIDNDGDGRTDEDTTQDNDADGDGRNDEDPPGDANGDGCPGNCNVDDDGDSQDHDGDMVPTWYELDQGTDPFDGDDAPEYPIRATDSFSLGLRHAIDTAPDDEDLDAMKREYYEELGALGGVDEESRHASCGGHPEYDDDEDGVCDEDGIDDNDADGDGRVDEDRARAVEFPADDSFNKLPDIHSRMQVQQFLQKYSELFDRFLGQINDWIRQTGRYDTQYDNEDGVLSSDVDTLVSLIAKKDAVTLQYLRTINNLLEQAIDEEWLANVQRNINVVTDVTISVTSARVIDGDGDEETLSSGDGALKTITMLNGTNKDHGVSAGQADEYFLVYRQELTSETLDDFPHLRGEAFPNIQSVAQCSPYRGSVSIGRNFGFVELNHKYNVNPREFTVLNDDGKPYFKAPKNFLFYGGCALAIMDERLFPEEYRGQCYEEYARLPVIDPAGTRRVTDADSVPETLRDYRACFDFTEEEHLEERLHHSGEASGDNILSELKDIIDEDPSGDPDHYAEAFSEVIREKDDLPPRYESATQLLLVDDGPRELTFREFIEGLAREGHLPSGTTSGNRRIWGEFFARGTRTVTLNFPVSGGDRNVVQRITARITPTVDHAIASTMFHKEPSGPTWSAQLANGATTDLPIDAPRFLTFKNRFTNQPDSATYPNVFAAETPEAFLSALQDIEAGLVSKANNNNAYAQLLRSKILAPAIFARLSDAILWRNMNIDEKHAAVLRAWLSGDVPAFTDGAEPRDGYEIFSFVADSSNPSQADLAFNPTVPDHETDLAFLQDGGGAASNDEDASAEDAAGSLGLNIYDVEAEGDEEVHGIPIWEWLEAIVEWLDSFTDISVSSSAAACGAAGVDLLQGVGGAFGALATEIAGSPPPDPADLTDADGDGIPEGAERTARLEISVEPLVLHSDGTHKALVSVSARKADGTINRGDHFTQLALSVTPQRENGAHLFGNPTPTLTNGVAFAQVGGARADGVYRVQASSTNQRRLSVTSEPIRVTGRQVVLSSYVKEQELLDRRFVQEDVTSLLIKNAIEEPVAEVTIATGQVRMLHDAYELRAAEATVELPTRVLIVRKSDEAVLANLLLLPQQQTAVLDPTSTNYATAFSELAGVHVRDAIPGDAYTLRKEGDTVRILEGNVIRGEILGGGDVFLADSLLLRVKRPVSSAEPFLLEIVPRQTPEGAALLELFIAVNFRQYQVQQFEGPYQPLSRMAYSIFQGTPSFSYGIFGIPKAYAQGQQRPAVHPIPDTDNDRLNDYEEWILKTNRTQRDTDGDSFSDGEEIEQGFDPLRKDAPLFTDLPKTHAGYGAVLTLYRKGIVSGFSDGTFRPDQPMTREEFLKVNLGAICLDCTKFGATVEQEIRSRYSQSPFPDTDINPALLSCVAYGKNEEIVSGFGGGEHAGSYLPRQTITRAEATKILAETAELSVPSHSLAGKPWYYNYVLAAQAAGLYPEQPIRELRTLGPQQFQTLFDAQLLSRGVLVQYLEGPVSRAEFAQMAVNLLQIRDCAKDDLDEDGLPNNAERFQFGTDPTKKDTDGGGVYDLNEIVRGTDPLFAGDDRPEQTGRVPADGSDGGLDPMGDLDGEGLLNGQEATFGTNPRDPDTDHGGVNDYIEVMVRGSNPLHAPDDRLNRLFGPGYYVVGGSIEERGAFREEGASSLTERIVPRFEMPADGQSKLFLRGEIVGSDGAINVGDSQTTVTFLPQPGSEPFAAIERQTIRARNGIAETEVQATTKAGLYVVSASTSGNFPVQEAEIDVYPGSPASIALAPKSRVLPAGGLSKTDVTATLFDRFQNVSNRDLHLVTVEVTGAGALVAPDNDRAAPGVQVPAIDGEATFTVQSTETAGEITVRASLPGEPPIAQTLTLQSRDDLRLEISASRTTLPADNDSTAMIRARLQDGAGNRLTDFEGTVTFALSGPELLTIATREVALVSGEATTTVRSKKRTGETVILASLPGFAPATFAFETVPGPVHSLAFIPPTSSLSADAPSGLPVRVQLLDRFGNVVTTNSSLAVSFRVTRDTERFGETRAPAGAEAVNGIAEGRVYPKGLSGPINVVAEADDVPPATLSLQVVKRWNGSDVSAIGPQVLYASLLGGAFGRVTSVDYLGGHFLFAPNSKTQAVTSLLEHPQPLKRLLAVLPQGAVQIFDTSSIRTRVTLSGAGLPRIVAEDPRTQKVVADIGVTPPPDRGFSVLTTTPSETTMPGIYLQKATDDATVSVLHHQGALSVAKDDVELARILRTGAVTLVDPRVSLALDLENTTPFAVFTLQLGQNRLARLVYAVPPQDVLLRPAGSALSGLYLAGTRAVVRPTLESSTVLFERAFLGRSSAEPGGILITSATDRAAASDRPGFGGTSLENAPGTNAIGLQGDNKHLLLFAAGNTVGVSNQPYASDIGVVLGDPTIALHRDRNRDGRPDDRNEAGFTDDVGAPIFSSKETPTNILPFDVNGDGLEDLLLSYSDGRIRLLQNDPGMPRFTDKGILLHIANGILSIDRGDLDRNGFDDLVIATKEPCKQGEPCVDLYANNRGQFTRQNLPIVSPDLRVRTIKVADVNNDRWPDVVTSNSAGAVSVLYNKQGEIDSQGQLVANLGVRIDPGRNYWREVLVRWNGMPRAGTTIAARHFQQLPLQTSSSGLSGELQQALADKGGPAAPHEAPMRSFLRLHQAPVLSNSEKSAHDVNGGSLAPGDRVRYTIRLRNSTAQTQSGISVSDLVSSLMTFDATTLSCTDCPQQPALQEPDVAGRPFILGPFVLGPGQTRTIQYEATLRDIPPVNLVIGNNFNDDYPADEFLDIIAMPKGNTSGTVPIYRSAGTRIVNGVRQVLYQRFIPPPPAPPSGILDLAASLGVNLTRDDDGNGIADDLEHPPEPPEEVPDEVKCQSQGMLFGDHDCDGEPDDTDGDGTPDLVDATVTIGDNDPATILSVSAEVEIPGLSAAADAVEGAIAALLCAGGCVPMPINIAFLVPGAFNVMGVPGGFDPGLPVFGWGVPSLIPIWPPSPYQAALGGRIYLSPTLTGGLGAAICLGPYPIGSCFAFAAPILQALGVCDAISGAIENALASANNAIASASGSMVIGGGGSSGGGDPSETDSGGVTAELGSYPISATAETNFQVPGFPAVITEWVTAQLREFLKLADLPDLTVIYPRLGSLFKDPFAGSTQTWEDVKGIRDVITYLNKLPLLRIEAKDLTLKIPFIPAAELEAIQEEWTAWTDAARDEVLQFRDDLVGTATGERILVKSERLIRTMEQNLRTIEEYKRLPRMLSDWRRIKVFYLQQIICYLDTITNFFGGYLLKNIKRAIAWERFVEDVKEAIETWQLLPRLFLDMMNTCDRCQSDRFTLMELLLRLFAAIPEPPVIPFPKWPNLVFDFSNIQAGLEVVIPNPRFRVVPMILPRIPRLQLNLPNLAVVLPEIPLLPPLPPLPELPPLPPLPVVSLPDLPPPPEVPEIPNEIQVALSLLRQLIRIFCLIKNGFLPVSELSLKSQVEQLTERSLTPLLPIDLSVQLNFPAIPIEYVDEIRANLFLNLGIDTSFIYDIAEQFTRPFNEAVTDVVDVWNRLMEEAQRAAETITNPIPDGPSGTIRLNLSRIEDAVFSAVTQDLTGAMDSLQTLRDRQLQTIAATPEEIRLTATQTFIDKQDPQLLALHLASVRTKLASHAPIPPGTEQFAAIQEKLLALHDTELALAADGTTWDRLLAQGTLETEAALASAESDTTLIAATTLPDLASSGDPLAEARQTFRDTTTRDLRLLAQGGAAGQDGSLPTTTNRGLFLVNPDIPFNGKLIMYTAELSEPQSFAFLDIDRDGDDDVVYAFSGDVYVKENFRNVPAPLRRFTDRPAVVRLSTIAPPLPAPHGLEVTSLTSNKATVAWDMLPDPTVRGYELLLRQAYDGFEPGAARTGTRIFQAVMEPDEAAAPAMGSFGPVRYAVIRGSAQIIRQTPAVVEQELSPGDIVATERGSAVSLTYPDGSVVAIGEEATFTLPDSRGGTITIAVPQGVVRTVPRDNHLFLRPGIVWQTGERGRAELVFDGVTSVTLPANRSFIVAPLQPPKFLVTERTGQVMAKTFGRSQLTRGDRALRAMPGERVHALEDTQLSLRPDATFEAVAMTLPAHRVWTVPASEATSVLVGVVQGEVEIIKQTRPDAVIVRKGMLLDFGDSMRVTGFRNGAQVRHASGIVTTLHDGDEVTFAQLSEPKLELTLQNGVYYGRVRALTTGNGRSILSSQIVIAPQDCADTSPPTIDVGKTAKRFPIFLPIEINAGASRDDSGVITNFRWDTNTSRDSNGDGDPTNDPDFSGPSPRLLLPAFEEPPAPSTLPMRLTVRDNSNNQTSADFTVEIFVPKVTLSEATADRGVVEGTIDTAIAGIPITVGRKRNEVWDALDATTTAADGSFSLSDLDLQGALIVQNSAGERIAEIHRSTGRITILDNRYHVEVLPAQPPLPTRIVILSADNEMMATIFLVTDANVDVAMDGVNVPYDRETVQQFSGVHVKERDARDTVRLSRIPADDPLYPGGLDVLDGAGRRVALIASDGSIFFPDPTRVPAPKLFLKPSETAEDPLILELRLGDELLADIYIAATNFLTPVTVQAGGIFSFLYGLLGDPLFNADSDGDGITDGWELTYRLNPQDAADASADPDGDGLSNRQEFQRQTNPLSGDTDRDGMPDGEEVRRGRDPRVPEIPFRDVTPGTPTAAMLQNLVDRNVLEGTQLPDGGVLFRPDDNIARAEFAKIILKILCIVPRPAAFTSPQVFSDIPFVSDLPWFYDETKESFLQGFITGYLGERNPATGLAPFKPDNPITRAEAAKIVLEALQKKGVIAMGNVLPGPNEPWYAPYLRIAQNLTLSLKNRDPLVVESFILTAAEAAEPNRLVTRLEFATIATRVLNAFDCFDDDADRDGLPDVWEAEQGLNDPNGDPDRDGLKNIEEWRLGTDPRDPDTDQGGVTDGKEVRYGMDPLNPVDEGQDDDLDGLVSRDEVNTHNTNPRDPDTDDGGVKDGPEVEAGTNPLDPFDDPLPAVLSETQATIADGLPEGIYAVAPQCTTCPCPAGITNTADMLPGDIIFGVIASRDRSRIFEKSNEIRVTSTTP